jgi:hypothetical protein
MAFFAQLLELVAVFLPDPLTLGLFTLALFNLLCIAKTLHVAGTLDTDAALRISLAIGYLITIAINILSSGQAPARPAITAVVQSKSNVHQAGRESSPSTVGSQPVGHRDAVIES